MMYDNIHELLRLVRDNNAMLHRIVDYVDRVDNAQYRDNEDMKAFVANVVANMASERLDGIMKNQR